MTDRIHALTVILDQDYRDDDVQSIIQAIQMTKGVLDVKMHVTDISDLTARERVKHEMQMKILGLFK
jgi:hypothetical protein